MFYTTSQTKLISGGNSKLKFNITINVLKLILIELYCTVIGIKIKTLRSAFQHRSLELKYLQKEPKKISLFVTLYLSTKV